MPACVVPGCDKKRALTYGIPVEDVHMCRRWLSAINNPSYDESTAADTLKNLRVCSHHFTPDDFKPNLKLELVGIKAKPELKEHAVPSLFPYSATGESRTSPPCKKPRAEEFTHGKKYSKEDLACALSELEQGGSLRKVGIKYGIPHTTLRDYKKKRYAHNPHPNRALTPEEEKALVTYILWRSEHGFPVTRAVVRALALNIIKSSQRSTLVNLDKGLSAMWWSRFRARHPELGSRTPDALDQPGAPGSPPEAVEGLFDICEPLYQKHGLGDKPHLIFNCSEIRFGDKPLARDKDQHHVQQNSSSSSEHITVHCCVSAAGESVPPFVIYPKCLPSTAYAQEGPSHALYALSPKGYMDGVLFLEWLVHFIKHAPAERPLVLFLDQHETHVCKEVVDVCRGNSIEVVCLPARNSCLLQPLDASVFGPLKTAFVSEASRMGLANGGAVWKRHFSAVLKHAYEQAVTPETIREGFRRTGLYPLCRTAINTTQAFTSDEDRPAMQHTSPSDHKVGKHPLQLTSTEKATQSTSRTSTYYARPVVHAKGRHVTVETSAMPQTTSPSDTITSTTWQNQTVSDQQLTLQLTSPSKIKSTSIQSSTSVQAQDQDRIPEHDTSEEEDNAASPLSTSSGTDEKSRPEDENSLRMFQGSSIFKNSEVLVNTRSLLELFRFCSVCLIECSVSIEGDEKHFLVTQACQSCGYHREWRNHPATTTEEPEDPEGPDCTEEHGSTAEPMRPEEPEGPECTEEPMRPEEPEGPECTEEPMSPEESEGSECTEEPEGPNEPMRPEEPEGPECPKEPIRPKEPEGPECTESPEESGRPRRSEELEKPEEPVLIEHTEEQSWNHEEVITLVEESVMEVVI